MPSSFHSISGKKYAFVEDSLRDSIMKAGRKKIVFVEGYDDKVIFEILYKTYLEQLRFIDASMEEAKRTTDPNNKTPGGCQTVKCLLKEFVSKSPNDKRFYGVIDRDLKKDEEILSEKSLPCYDSRLFIFFDRYTLENYFIEVDILCDFLREKSINNKKLLLPLIANEKFKEEITEIVKDILKCLTEIGAANLTIRFFDASASFLEPQIGCAEIEKRLKSKLNNFPEEDLKLKFNEFKSFIEKTNNALKFASAKTYFSYQFTQNLQKKGVNGADIHVDRNKPNLARILKDYELPNDFKELLNFLSVH